MAARPMLIMGSILSLSAVCLAGAAATSRPAAADAIEDAIRAAGGTDDAAVIPLLSQQLTARYGREASGPLVELMLRADVPWRGRVFVAFALINIVDPNDDHGLKSALDKPGEAFMNPGGLAVAAVATPQDAIARKQLLRLAVAGSDYACGFLRSHNPKEVRPAIEAALRDEKTLPVARSNLRALLSSMAYADGLNDPKDLASYQTFERRLWRAYALAAKGDEIAGLEYGRAAAAILKDDPQPDERFIIRALEDPTATEAETLIASGLAVQLRTPGLRRQLKALAAGGLPRAAIARRLLDEITKSERNPAPRPIAPGPRQKWSGSRP